MIFNKKRLIIGIALLIFNNISFGQRQTFKCVALYNETHEPLHNVQMQLVCKRASYKGVDYDTIRSVTDENGYASFDKVIRPGATQFILYCADKNYKQFNMPIENDTSKINVYFVMDKLSDEYFPEFYFDDNSAAPKDTSTYAKVDFKQFSSYQKVQLTGFVAPNENMAIATKRVESVLKGFVEKGIAVNHFVITPPNPLQNAFCSVGCIFVIITRIIFLKREKSSTKIISISKRATERMQPCKF